MISEITDLPSQVLQTACENTEKKNYGSFFKRISISDRNTQLQYLRAHHKNLKKAVISLSVNPQDIGNLNQYLDKHSLEMEKDCNIKHNFDICSQKTVRTIFFTSFVH